MSRVAVDLSSSYSYEYEEDKLEVVPVYHDSTDSGDQEPTSDQIVFPENEIETATQEPADQIKTDNNSKIVDIISGRNPNLLQQAITSLPIPPVYRCSRSRKIIGYPSFSFYKENQLLLTAERKSIKSHRLVMRNAAGDIVADFRVCGKHHFSLLDHGDDKSQALIHFQVHDVRPRSVTFDIVHPEKHFVNRKPKFNERKCSWQLGFDSHFTIRSRKNCVIVDSNNFMCFTVRKIERDNLEIVMMSNLDIKFMFMFGIASFMCKE